MQLLKKSAVQGELAQQRKQLIDEGVKIASKVDLLRQTLADLEVQQAQFVEKSRMELEAQTKTLFNEVVYRKQEIESLEEQKRLLLIPLDEEWNKVQEKTKEVDSLAIDLISKIEKLESKERLVEEKNTDAKNTLYRINVRERELIKLYDNEKIKESEINERVNETIARQDEIEKYFENKNSELLSREAVIAVKERENQIAKEKNEEERQDIINIKIQLEDQRLTLEDLVKKYNK